MLLEEQVITHCEQLLTPKAKELVRQAVWKTHGMEVGRVAVQKLTLARDHPLANALWLHKIVELTLYANLGYDLVHNGWDEQREAFLIDPDQLYSDLPGPHYTSTVLNARYVLAHARTQGIQADLTQLIALDPLATEDAREALLHDKQPSYNPELHDYLTHLMNTSTRLWKLPLFFSNKKHYEKANDHFTPVRTVRPLELPTQTRSYLVAVPETQEFFTHLAQGIRETWEDSRYGTSIIMQGGKMTVNKNDYNPLLDESKADRAIEWLQNMLGPQ